MKSQYFTEEHELFRDSVKQFVAKEILPFGNQWEKDEKIPRDLFVKLGEQGFLGINHDEQFGGSKADIFYTCAYLEELAKSYHNLVPVSTCYTAATMRYWLMNQ